MKNGKSLTLLVVSYIDIPRNSNKNQSKTEQQYTIKAMGNRKNGLGLKLKAH